MDCVLKTYATILVANNTDFCNKVLYENIIVGRYSDSKGKFLTDKYLCENLEKLLAMDVCGIYSKTSGFIHFSPDSFHNTARTQGDGKIELFISKTICKEEEQTYLRLSIELINDFYFFGKILIELVLKS